MLICLNKVRDISKCFQYFFLLRNISNANEDCIIQISNSDESVDQHFCYCEPTFKESKTFKTWNTLNTVNIHVISNWHPVQLLHATWKIYLLEHSLALAFMCIMTVPFLHQIHKIVGINACAPPLYFDITVFNCEFIAWRQSFSIENAISPIHYPLSSSSLFFFFPAYTWCSTWHTVKSVNRWTLVVVDINWIMVRDIFLNTSRKLNVSISMAMV